MFDSKAYLVFGDGGGSMGSDKVLAAVAAALLSVVASRANAETLHGMAQVSRDDGLLVFLLVGSFDDRSVCERVVLEFAENFISGANGAGQAGKLDTAVCSDRVPKNTEFEALRYGTRTTHYVFFTPNMRAMFVHPRGNLDYEKQTCEFLRGQMLSKLGVAAKCNAPRPEWLSEKPSAG